MRLNAPKQNFWWISIIVGVLGVLAQLVTIPFITANAFWFVTVGFALLAVSTVVKGM